MDEERTPQDWNELVVLILKTANAGCLLVEIALVTYTTLALAAIVWLIMQILKG